MASNALTNRALTGTLSALQTDDLTAVSPRDGVSLVKDWLTVVEGHAQAGTVQQWLQQLYGQLQLAQPNTDRIREIMLNLADQTALLGQSKGLNAELMGQLEELATQLRRFGSQL